MILIALCQCDNQTHEKIIPFQSNLPWFCGCSCGDSYLHVSYFFGESKSTILCCNSMVTLVTIDVQMDTKKGRYFWHNDFYETHHFLSWNETMTTKASPDWFVALYPYLLSFLTLSIFHKLNTWLKKTKQSVWHCAN